MRGSLLHSALDVIIQGTAGWKMKSGTNRQNDEIYSNSFFIHPINIMGGGP
jgi:hypothetical protein